VISVAEDVRDIAGWPAIEWGMTEEDVRDALAGRVSAITPVAHFARAYASIKGSVTIEECRLEMFPQFSHASGELCQVLFRATEAGADRLSRLTDRLTARYGAPITSGTRRTWRGTTGVVELDTVPRSSDEAQWWLRWYPVTDAEGG
jgi:hypothetical protein